MKVVDKLRAVRAKRRLNSSRVSVLEGGNRCSCLRTSQKHDCFRKVWQLGRTLLAKRRVRGVYHKKGLAQSLHTLAQIGLFAEP